MMDQQVLGIEACQGKKSEFGRKLQAALSRAKKTMIKHHQASSLSSNIVHVYPSFSRQFSP
jgi:hypothetical protein